MKTKQLSMNELKDAFFSLKISKSPGYDGTSIKVLKNCFSSLQRVHLTIWFHLFLEFW